MHWTNIEDIAIALNEKFPNKTENEILNISFPNLHKLITELEGFDDDPKKSNERILEAILEQWLAEKDNDV
jgi:FeS assembly protein IscX